jgi:hypothetical protein
MAKRRHEAQAGSARRHHCAIALISRTRRSARSGRMFSRRARQGDRFYGGFCQEIDSVTDSVDRSVGFSDNDEEGESSQIHARFPPCCLSNEPIASPRALPSANLRTDSAKQFRAVYRRLLHHLRFVEASDLLYESFVFVSMQQNEFDQRIRIMAD